MSKSLVVLVVEDDEDDFFFVERLLKKCGVTRIYRVETGPDAIDYLAGERAFADRTAYPPPELVFLDLKLDRGSGHQVLQWIASTLTQRPTVCVLTGSNEAKDREAVERTGVAAAYYVKPLRSEQVQLIVTRLA